MALKRIRYSLSVLILLAFVSGRQAAHAQDFQPPRPPPLDPATDFEDMEEDMMEMGDEGFRPPNPPPPPGMQNNAPPPPPDYHATGSAFGNNKKTNKVFTIVDGEYWEKGKKRSRGITKHLAPSPGGS